MFTVGQKVLIYYFNFQTITMGHNTRKPSSDQSKVKLFFSQIVRSDQIGQCNLLHSSHFQRLFLSHGIISVFVIWSIALKRNQLMIMWATTTAQICWVCVKAKIIVIFKWIEIDSHKNSVSKIWCAAFIALIIQHVNRRAKPLSNVRREKEHGIQFQKYECRRTRTFYQLQNSLDEGYAKNDFYSVAAEWIGLSMFWINEDFLILSQVSWFATLNAKSHVLLLHVIL